MDPEQDAGSSSAAVLEGRPTRGFLFSDLRGYTAFVESNGAASATDLLARYRRHVRQAVAHHRGAEIRTEGDGFYIVFPSVSSAVTCGLEILAAAAGDTTGPPIAIGIGVHAGEAADTSEGFVGSAVNVAARLCAIAGPGEIFVSDTVRALTKSVLDVTFVSKGRRTLKGVAEPLLVFAVRPSAEGAIGHVGRVPHRSRVVVVGLALVLALVLAVGVGGAGLIISGLGATSSAKPSLQAVSTVGPSASAPRLSSPSPTPAMNGPEGELLKHVPGQFRAGCVPGPQLGVKAQIVCSGPPGIPVIIFTAYDNVAAMGKVGEPSGYGTPFGLIPTCPAGGYQRPYYQAPGTQKGTVACYVNANIPQISWTDEGLAISVTAKSIDAVSGGGLSLEGLHRWWEQREAGPIP